MGLVPTVSVKVNQTLRVVMSSARILPRSAAAGFSPIKNYFEEWMSQGGTLMAPWLLHFI
jgi:hypothetical protein